MVAGTEEARLKIEDLLLDPNNPRYADLDVSRQVPEERLHEDTVQDTALHRMLDERFDVDQLKQSILKAGFIDVDRLVVVQLPKVSKYVVIEGNRRVAALRSLINDEAEGVVTLPETLKSAMSALPALLVTGSNAEERDTLARTLQGIRHTPGVKQWGPYQQAQFVAVMLAEGQSLLDIKSTLGLPAVRINSLRRVHSAMEQMKADPEYGELAKPHLFSNFEEALKLPRVREWLQWDDSRGLILGDQQRDYFYGWIVGVEEDGERRPAKIVDAKDFRSLPRLLDNTSQMQRFLDDPDLTLRDAARAIPQDEPAVDWRSVLATDLNALRLVPAIDLSSASEGDVQLLERVREACTALLDQIRLVQQAAANHAPSDAE